MKFRLLIDTIRQTHTVLQQEAFKAVNVHLTVRNWVIGYLITEFEQKGEDRARYGEKLLAALAAKLSAKNISNTSERELRRYRKFYQVYSGLAEQIRGTLSPISGSSVIRGTLSPELTTNHLLVPADKIMASLSFSHLAELLDINDPVKRTFYEVECIKGTWSVRELRRQVNSLYYERSGLSKKPGKLSALVAASAEKQQPADFIKSVYAFEFLGLQPKDVVEETELETALLDHLQDFIREMGRGFCLEARQQKILIGDEYFFIDLVFYHRILKCHVLVDLKIEEFNHINAGQMNSYINYYKKEVMQPDDKPPVGILMVTNKNKTLVEYATAGMDNKLFVSKYMVQLPAKKQLEKFISDELKKL